MKRHLFKSLVVCALMVFATSAWSLTIADVGSIDNLLASDKLANSGAATEQAWVESILGYSVTFAFKDDVLGQWEAITDQVGVYAHPLETNPEYFLVKTGNVTDGDVARHFLFENLADLSYAVIDLEEMGFKKITNITGVSHITEYNPQVPEPGTLLLLGSGLVGLAILRRRERD